MGFSFPLFENRNKVKIAKAQALNIDLQKDNATLQVESELAQLYREAKNAAHLYGGTQEKLFQAQQDLALLKQALTGGQISMIEYFCRGIRHFIKVTRIPPTGESNIRRQWHEFIRASYKFRFIFARLLNKITEVSQVLYIIDKQ